MEAPCLLGLLGSGFYVALIKAKKNPRSAGVLGLWVRLLLALHRDGLAPS